ncbi:MAG: TolC family protein [Marinoscillum sp.]
MKKLLYLILGCTMYAANAQHPGLNQYNEEFAQLLVRTALKNNPQAEVARRGVYVAEYDVKLASAEWLNAFRFSGNINEFNIDPDRDIYNRSQFLPRYNLGASINFGMFLTIPYETKRSKEELMISQSVEDSYELTLEAQVLRQYHNYILQRKIFKLQEEELMNAENNFKLREEQFTRGEISFDDYSGNRSVHNQTQVTYFRAEAALRDARVNLEELIGVKLEEVY